MSGVTTRPYVKRAATGFKSNTQPTSCALCKRTWGNEVKKLKVPSNVVIRQRWEAICGKQFTSSAKICEKHFLLTDFKETEGSKRRRLKPNTVPSLLLPPLTSSLPNNSCYQTMNEDVNMVVEESAQTLPTTQDCCTQEDKQSIICVRACVMVYDNNRKRWVPSGSSSGLSKVQIYHHKQNNTFRVVGRKLQDREVVINCSILKGHIYNQATTTFHQLRDSKFVYGLNFSNQHESKAFARAVVHALKILSGRVAKNAAGQPINDNGYEKDMGHITGKVTPSAQTPTLQAKSKEIEAERCRENEILKQQIKELQAQYSLLKKRFDARESLIMNIKKLFTEGQLKRLHNPNIKTNWCWDDISSAITLHSTGSRAYKYLRGKGFPLPSISTLKEWKKESSSLVLTTTMNNAKSLPEFESLVEKNTDAIQDCSDEDEKKQEEVEEA